VATVSWCSFRTVVSFSHLLDETAPCVRDMWPKLVCSSAGPRASRRLDSADAGQLLGVGHEMDGPVDPLGHVEDKRRDVLIRP
jgi:hypothetical protein